MDHKIINKSKKESGTYFKVINKLTVPGTVDLNGA